MLALQELRVSRSRDAHLLQHLLHDHANVLVVDLHALQAVHLLHFVEQVFLYRARPLDAKDVVRIDRTFRQILVMRTATEDLSLTRSASLGLQQIADSAVQRTPHPAAVCVALAPEPKQQV